MKRTLQLLLLLAVMLCGINVSVKADIKSSGGWFEACYVTWDPITNASGYNVYVAKSGGSYTKIDDELVRKYNDNGYYYRADAMGLTAGTYTMKVVPLIDGAENADQALETGSLTVKAHDRSGFAFKGSQMPGAYNSDGTLKNNAVVIYVTNDNKNTLTQEIIYTSKGVKQSCTGILAVLTALKKGYETRPIDIRVIGNVTASDMVLTDLTDGTTQTAIASASDFKGDLMISTNKKDCGGVTIEGVGCDATANGWGIRFKALNYGEASNLGFMNCNSDETDNIGLQQDNNYCWVHNCDMFYGNAGSDADQVKGDGALDCKKSNYITMSYNHFWDNGKCNLLGLSEGVNSYADAAYYITYHHNWYDHSDSRHPRCRYYNAHVYNNYYDGNAKYGAGACLAASVFMEGNYFRSCKFPMMISMQGSDVYAGTTTRDTKNNPTFSKENGGMIKAYNNYMTGSCTFIPYGASTYTLKGTETAIGAINSSADFDAYVVTDKSTTVPSTITSYAGSNYYSNFDTSSDMYSYTAEEPADAMATITGTYGAGRMQHGDFQWTFTNSTDDSKYAVDDDLKSAITSYTSKFVCLANETSKSACDLAVVDGKSTMSLTYPGTYTLAATTDYTTSSTGALSYSSDNTSVATVDATGLITAISGGTAKITISQAADASYYAGSAVITLTVSDGRTESTFALSSNASVDLVAGNTSAITTSNAAGTVTYKSSDESVATVSADGTITAIAAGEAIITVSDAGSATVKPGSKTVKVNVTDGRAASTFALTSGAKVSIKETETSQIAYTGAAGTVTYSSSNESVATVSESGLITAVAAGSATITVTDAGTEAKQGAEVTISVSVTKDMSGKTVVTFSAPSSGKVPVASDATLVSLNSSSNGTATAYTHDGVEYNYGTKIESSTEVDLTPTADAAITLITDKANTKIKVNGTDVTTDANGEYTFYVTGGKTYALTKNASMNLYAVVFDFSVKVYTVTYNINGHGDAVAQETAIALANPLPTLSATGYTFGGWYTDSELTTAAVAGATLAENTTLYAKWTENTPAFTTQPATSTNVTYGSISGTLTATASDAQSYTWYQNSSKSTEGATQVGTDQSLTIPTTLAEGTYYFYCVAKNVDKTAQSDYATVTVNAAGSPDVLFSYEFSNTGLSKTTDSGTGTNCTVSWSSLGGTSTSSNCTLLSNVAYWKLTSDDAYVKITLSSGSFASGDVITIDAYMNSTSAGKGFYIKSKSGNKISATGTKAAQTFTYILTSDDINSDGTITLYRIDSNSYIHGISGTRPDATEKSTACQLTSIQFSNSVYGSITEPTASKNGSVTVPYMAGTTEPTITGSSIKISEKASYAINGSTLVVSAEDGTTTATYDITKQAITPLVVTADIATTAFTAVPSWIYSPYGYDASKGLRFAKAVDESSNMRIAKGYTRQYYFISAAKTLTLTSFGTSRAMNVYVNGTKLSSPTASGTSTVDIALDETRNNMVCIESNQTNGDGGFTKYAITLPSPYELSESKDYASFIEGTRNVKLTKTFSAGNWSTICLPFSVSKEQLAAAMPTGTKVANITSQSDNKIYYTVCDGLSANVPALIYVPTLADGNTYTFSGVTVANPTGALTSVNGTVTLTGVYEKKNYQNLPTDLYFLYSGKFYDWSYLSDLTPFTAYFQVSGGLKAKGLQLIDFSEVPTDIDAVENDSNDAPAYNLNGQRVKSSAKGIIIKNGKKLLVK